MDEVGPGVGGPASIVGVADELLGDVPVETFLAPAQPRPPGGPRGNRVGQYAVKGHARQRRQFADRAHVSGYRLGHANLGVAAHPASSFRSVICAVRGRPFASRA